MNNQKGFIFPLTLGVALITFFVIMASIEIFLSERRYLQETEEYYLANSMNALALKKIVGTINDGDFMNKGLINFNEGEVNFTIEEKDKGIFTIFLDSKLNKHQVTKNEVIYRKKDRRILKWLEK